MDLSATWLGLRLPHPLVPSAAQPLSRDLDSLLRLEDAGASAVVVHSLFEEQVMAEQRELEQFLDRGVDSFPEALSFFPAPDRYQHGLNDYLDLVRAAKERLSIPVVGSLNGVTPGGWTEYGKLLEDAGADALELNIYYIPTDPDRTGEDVERVYLDVLEAVKRRVRIPVSAKIGPFFSSLPNFTRRLERAGAGGIALFNRFYNSDIYVETLEVDPHLVLSTSSESLLPLRWIAILRSHLHCSLSATSGVYTAEDALKLVMAGADVVHLCGALLKHGPARLGEIRDGMARWLEQHEYESLADAQGILCRETCPDPSAFERANYMKAIHSWK
ncbi:MAG: dihydroorotate dehydrogenase-like protein [Planctomycetaceae bacterium]|nr:dihydroorotate dehydrogenase-like protein [Planctomycetota bacterium]NUN52074.1 dihydroorotate dehydrogenase-like protein [Planctomycetaceae bacterium]